MVTEAHRLGRKVVVHARGREAVLYAARAGVDLIFHAYYLDDECIEAMLQSGSAIGPTMTFLRNIIDFTQPHEPAATEGPHRRHAKRNIEIACVNLRKARKAGVPMMTGTDSGFAVTPYGEWHARELEIFVARSRLHAGRGAALRHRGRRAVHGATATSSACWRTARSPISSRSTARRCENIAILQDKTRIRPVHIGGKRMQIPDRGYDPRQVTDRAWTNWTDLYTQERVAALREARLAAE